VYRAGRNLCNRLLLLKKSIQRKLQASFFSFTDTVVSLFPAILLLVRGLYQLRAVSKEPHQPFQILCHRC
jgi:hypothetical protein